MPCGLPRRRSTHTMLNDPPHHPSNFSRMLRRAVRAHEEGELGKARRLYAAVLRHDPMNFDALHLVGLLDHQCGSFDRALAHYDDALRIIPGDPEALNK